MDEDMGSYLWGDLNQLQAKQSKLAGTIESLSIAQLATLWPTRQT